MARSSETFRWLLRLLEEQHEHDLASLVRENPNSKTRKEVQREHDLALLAKQLTRESGAAGDPANIATGPPVESSGSSVDSTAGVENARTRSVDLGNVEVLSIDVEKAEALSVEAENAEAIRISSAAMSNTSVRSVTFLPPEGEAAVSDEDSRDEEQSPPPMSLIPTSSKRMTVSQPYRYSKKQKNTEYQVTKSFKLLHAWLDVTRYKEKDPVQVTSLRSSEQSVSNVNHAFRSSEQFANATSNTMGKRLNERLDALALPFIIDPGSIFRTAWGFASLLVLCYEIVIVPPECFIGFPPSPWMEAMRWASRVFWTLDLPLNFVTGFFNMSGLELRLSAICVNYLKTWLAFDVILVGSDWFSLAFSDVSSGAPFLVTLRAVRILRLLRLLRIARLQHLVSDLLTVGPDTVVGCAGLVKISIGICVLVHVLSCFWYAIGELDGGWATRIALTNAPSGEKYQHALYWTITRVHGASAYEPRITTEYAFATLMVCFGFIAMSVFVGKTTHTAMVLVDRRKVEMQQICRNYMRTRNVSANLQIRLNKYLAQCHQKSFKEAVEHETEMLQSLPVLLQTELHTEIRKPLLLSTRFLREVPQRMLRMLCFEALTCVVAVNPERVFERAVMCTRLLLVEGGFLTYYVANFDRRTLSTDLMDWMNFDKDQDGELKSLSRGASVSEASLWTEWSHCGELKAESDVTILALEVSKFVPTISKMETCFNVTINYARRYLINLNKYVEDGGQLSDILELDVDITNIDELPKNYDIHFEHLIFLSHFKKEAGTEAALMENDLAKLIHEDESHPASNLVTPCFLDSEDLVDLSGLRDHVRKSHNLLVLLTPGLLTRPWCLIEIVTAVRDNVNLVPVEIQRPGLQFQYPDEQYFNALCNGETLNENAVKVLAEEGIDLIELATCLRQVFLKIAVAYSPHKSAKVRQAELCDILERCVIQRRSQIYESDDILNDLVVL